MCYRTLGRPRVMKATLPFFALAATMAAFSTQSFLLLSSSLVMGKTSSRISAGFFRSSKMFLTMVSAKLGL